MAYKRHEMKVILFEQGDSVFTDDVDVTNYSDNDATTGDVGGGDPVDGEFDW